MSNYKVQGKFLAVMFKDKAYGYGLNRKLIDKFCGQRKTISFIDTIYWYILWMCYMNRINCYHYGYD
jgi:hypothetical protein